MASIGKMIEQLDGLRDTKDVTDWENTFITSICDKYFPAKDTRNFSEKQVEILERIFKKHYA